MDWPTSENCGGVDAGGGVGGGVGGGGVDNGINYLLLCSYSGLHSTAIENTYQLSFPCHNDFNIHNTSQAGKLNKSKVVRPYRIFHSLSLCYFLCLPWAGMLQCCHTHFQGQGVYVKNTNLVLTFILMTVFIKQTFNFWSKILQNKLF